MPNHPYDRSANYTSHRQAFEMLIFQTDGLVWGYVWRPIYLIYFMDGGQVFES